MKCEEAGVVLCSEIFQYVLSCHYSVHFMVRNTNLLNIGFCRKISEVSGFLMTRERSHLIQLACEVSFEVSFGMAVLPPFA